MDVILDPVGGQYLMDNPTALGLGGRLVLIGLMSGVVAEANLGLLMMKRARVIGSTLSSTAYRREGIGNGWSTPGCLAEN